VGTALAAWAVGVVFGTGTLGYLGIACESFATALAWILMMTVLVPYVPLAVLLVGLVVQVVAEPFAGRRRAIAFVLGPPLLAPIALACGSALAWSTHARHVCATMHG
jgi:hypothetical protein